MIESQDPSLNDPRNLLPQKYAELAIKNGYNPRDAGLFVPSFSVQADVGVVSASVGIFLAPKSLDLPNPHASPLVRPLFLTSITEGGDITYGGPEWPAGETYTGTDSNSFDSSGSFVSEGRVYLTGSASASLSITFADDLAT